MNTAERTEIAAAVPIEVYEQWKRRIESLGIVSVVQPTSMGLVMMKAEESVAKEKFYVGELLTTDATVAVDGVVGYGIVMGHQPDKAYTLALLDAVYNSTDDKWVELRRLIDHELKEQRQELIKQKRLRFQLIGRTKVDFEAMDID